MNVCRCLAGIIFSGCTELLVWGSWARAYPSCLAVSAWASSNVGFALFLLPHADGRDRRGVHGFRGARGARYSRRGFGLSSA